MVYSLSVGGIGTAYLINGSAVLDLLENQQMWILLGFVLVRICLFFVAGPTRPLEARARFKETLPGSSIDFISSV